MSRAERSGKRMDRVMIQKVYNCDKQQLRKKGYNKTNFVEDSWSSLEIENNELPVRYKDYQDSVRKLANEKDLIPIEYDYYIWQPL